MPCRPLHWIAYLQESAAGAHLNPPPISTGLEGVCAAQPERDHTAFRFGAHAIPHCHVSRRLLTIPANMAGPYPADQPALRFDSVACRSLQLITLRCSKNAPAGGHHYEQRSGSEAGRAALWPRNQK